jgi:hypothetical protein
MNATRRASRALEELQDLSRPSSLPTISKDQRPGRTYQRPSQPTSPLEYRAEPASC